MKSVSMPLILWVLLVGHRELNAHKCTQFKSEKFTNLAAESNLPLIMFFSLENHSLLPVTYHSTD